jgi:hypothetical protein
LLIFFVLAGLLFTACEQPAGGGGNRGGGNIVEITISDAAALAKIGVDSRYPLDGAYTLGADLVLENRAPIGTYAGPFTGAFNGNNKTVTVSGEGGIFGFTKGARIRNVKVAGTITKTGGAKVAVYAGGIAGFARNTEITSCVSSVNITLNADGHNSSAGGIAGYLNEGCLIADCSASGSITLESAMERGLMVYAGGIAGYQGLAGSFAGGDGGCVIERCSFTGNVTIEGAYPYGGGIAGYNYAGSIIRQSYAAGGTIAVTGGNLPYAGAVAGYNSRDSLIENCYGGMAVNAVAKSKQALAGGITGSNAAGSVVSKCYALGAVSATVDGSGTANAGGSMGVPAKANAGGIAGAQYFGAPSIKNCAALNTKIEGKDSSVSGAAYNVRRIAGGGTGGESDAPAWAANIGSAVLTAGGTTVASVSKSDGEDGADCAAKPAEADYTALGWDFDAVWKMGGNGYPALKWETGSQD